CPLTKAGAGTTVILLRTAPLDTAGRTPESERSGTNDADDQPTGAQAAGAAVPAAEAPGPARLPAEEGRLPAGQDHDPQEAELGPAEGGPRAPLQRRRGDGLHPGRGP